MSIEVRYKILNNNGSFLLFIYVETDKCRGFEVPQLFACKPPLRS